MKRILLNPSTRREWIRNTIGLGLMSFVEGPNLLYASTAPTIKAQRNPNGRYLIVMQGSGGASIIDSCMAIQDTEVTAAGGDATTMNCFTAQQLVAVPNTSLRAVNYSGTIPSLGSLSVTGNQSSFVQNHYQEMLVATLTGTSITHPVAQERSVNGNGAWAGRTLQEICAATYGKDLPVANLLLGSGGYVVPGSDPTVPNYALGIPVSDSRYWSAGLSRTYNIEGAPSADLMTAALDVRNQMMDAQSAFFKTFKNSQLMQNWVTNRSTTQQTFIDQNLAANLSLAGTGPAATTLRTIFPNYMVDDLEAQAILACLAITQDVSCAVTMGPGFAGITTGGLSNLINPPIAFDYSHADHRGIQAMMWTRIYSVVDRMSTFLKAQEFGNGQSFWDRTMVYFATDFGRSKLRPASSQSFSSGHDLNNGVLIVSPMAKGNQVLGGVDPSTGLTYGFDPATGAPNKSTTTAEKELFCGLLQIMGVDTSPITGATNMQAMLKA